MSVCDEIFLVVECVGICWCLLGWGGMVGWDRTLGGGLNKFRPKKTDPNTRHQTLMI